MSQGGHPEVEFFPLHAILFTMASHQIPNKILLHSLMGSKPNQLAKYRLSVADLGSLCFRSLLYCEPPKKNWLNPIQPQISTIIALHSFTAILLMYADSLAMIHLLWFFHGQCIMKEVWRILKGPFFFSYGYLNLKKFYLLILCLSSPPDHERIMSDELKPANRVSKSLSAHCSEIDCFLRVWRSPILPRRRK